ncbi:hypothetical protein SY83_00330 [Paenibacillus swuensis]|uniref:Uncharacterized protein n=1 Tax=Paenibacillus swuensis TaxID=1178515 RepID=A0A172TDK4_9BACL|nr:hypothetical protein [Paenibacillus swuensis]ANE45081.1 hypothetical protein SY83_00330 [Paenibacillus swuensis]
MIPFNRTWPYDIMMNDIYVTECPYCLSSNVLLPLRKSELSEIHDGRKKLLVFPCCHARVTLVDVDSDYLLANEPFPNRGQ